MPTVYGFIPLSMRPGHLTKTYARAVKISIQKLIAFCYKLLPYHESLSYLISQITFLTNTIHATASKSILTLPYRYNTIKLKIWNFKMLIFKTNEKVSLLYFIRIES